MSRILPIEMKEFTASSLNGTYQTFGSVLSHPAIKIMIHNTSDVDVYLSKDGLTNMCRIPSFGTMTFDESTLYFRGIDQEYYLSKGTQLYLKQVTAPGTLGSIICHLATRVQ